MVELALPSDEEASGMAVEKLIELQNRRAKRLSKRHKQRKAKSSDAEVCLAFQFDKINARLNKPDDSRTIFARTSFATRTTQASFAGCLLPHSQAGSTRERTPSAHCEPWRRSATAWCS